MMMYGTHAAMTLTIVTHVVFHLALLTLVVLGSVWVFRALRTQSAHEGSSGTPRRRDTAAETGGGEYRRRQNGPQT